jgi:hypothetical protein
MAVIKSSALTAPVPLRELIWLLLVGVPMNQGVLLVLSFESISLLFILFSQNL